MSSLSGKPLSPSEQVPSNNTTTTYAIRGCREIPLIGGDRHCNCQLGTIDFEGSGGFESFSLATPSPQLGKVHSNAFELLPTSERCLSRVMEMSWRPEMI